QQVHVSTGQQDRNPGLDLSTCRPVDLLTIPGQARSAILIRVWIKGQGTASSGSALLVEGYNGANMHAMNAKAIETAGRLNLPYTGGSDAHLPREVGSCYTEFDGPVTYDNFIACLRAGRFKGVDTRKISRHALP
ncbi:MAG: hypothetical protein HGB21_05740, partial [Nitrospirae bacterium]|nr:hypothetical protein [Nitrospirota bacterium]